MELEDFVRELNSLCLNPLPVLDFIKNVYIAYELPYEVGSKSLFQVEKWILNLLFKHKRYNFVDEFTTYGKIANVRYYRIKDEGVPIGSQIIQKHILQVKDELIGTLEHYGRRLSRVIALGSIRPSVNREEVKISWIEVPVKGSSLDNAFSRTTNDFEFYLIEHERLQRIYMESKKLYGNLSLVFERLRDARRRIYTPYIYEMFMSNVLLLYNGRVHGEVLELMEELCSLGLALRIPRYSSKGEYIGDVYKAPPEVTHILLQYSSSEDLTESMKPFLAADILLRALRGEITKGELLEAIDKVGISEDEVRVAVNMLNSKGITSKYNEEGSLDSPPFIILKEKNVIEEAMNFVNLAENIILRR